MLKIRDGVDLKELEKYGFKPRYDTYTGEIYEFENVRSNYITLTCHSISKSILSIFYIKEKKKKKWYFKSDIRSFEDEVQDIIYDLIKADLVEKVGE